MEYLVDTNILLRFADRNHSLHPMVRNAVRKLRQSGNRLNVVFQNFAEFWNAATRPATKNGFGLTHADADRRLRMLERIFPLLPDHASAFPIWRGLVVAYSVSGVQVHDARLVATMKSHGITHILTLNTGDFVRYAPEGITAIHPANV